LPITPYNYALRHFEGFKTIWTTVRERHGCAGRACTGAASPPSQEASGQSWRHRREKGRCFSHTLVVLKKKWLQSPKAWGKRRALEPMTGATDDFSEMPGSAYCGISHKETGVS
jgi:hypothetical protein